MKPLCLAAGLFLCCAPVLAAPAFAAPAITSKQGQAVPGFSSQRAEELVGENSRAVVRALQNNDTLALAQFVHPTRGVQFSPYVNIENDALKFTRSQMPFLANHPKKFAWGEADGTGDEIQLTWNEFRRRHLVPRKFVPGATENFNRLFQNGNTYNTLEKAYPNAVFARFYLPGTERYGGMDWRAIYLAWRPVGKNWYLVGVAGDQWTI